MKHLIAIVLLLFCAALGTLICTAVSLQADVSDVRMTEVTHQGDIQATEGLTIISKNHWDYHGHWTTTHTFGHAENAETDFDFTAGRRYAIGNPHVERLTMDAFIENGIDFSDALKRFNITMGEASAQNFDITSAAGTFREAATDPALGISAAFNALYMDAPLNEEVSTTVNLRDYYEYYPISLQLNLPGVIWTHRESTTDTVAKPGTQAYVEQVFRDYFKIPMLDETMEIHLKRSNHGMGWGSSSGDSDTYSPYAISAANATDCYFTFNTTTNRDETTIDTAEIKGGYGIYRLPYRQSTSTADIGVNVDAMEMIYPLQPGTKIEELSCNTAGTRLLLVTKADETTVQIDVIDTVTYQKLQSFSVYGKYIYSLRIFDTYTVAVTSDCLSVLTEEDGVYTHAFTTDIIKDDYGIPTAITSDHVLAFDGSRLAVADNAKTQYYFGRDLCAYTVTVYSADGLLWYGTVENTLDVGIRQNSYTQDDIQPFYGEHLALIWE